MRLDSSGNMLWVKDLHPLPNQGLAIILQLNDGCFLANISELMPNNNRRPRLVCFNMDGDTLWSRHYNPQGLGIGQSTNVSFTRVRLNSQGYVFAAGYYWDPLLSGNARSLFIEFDSIGNELYRYSHIGGIEDFHFLDSGRYLELFGTGTSNSNYGIKINHRTINNTLLDSFVISTNGVIGFASFILNDSSDIILTASRDSFPATQGWDLHFARYEQSWGRRYEHNYCGQNLPKAGLSLQVTSDSVFFSDSSFSGLRCISELYDVQWSIPALGLSQNGGNSWRMARNQLAFTHFDIQYKIKNYFDCPDSMTIAVDLVNGILGTENVLEQTHPQLSISPNPAKDRVMIKTGTQAVKVTDLRLFTLSGHELELSGRMQEEGVLLLEGLPAGLYLLHYLGKEAPQIKKLMVGG